MAEQPWLLDAFCCAGGATRGYQRAGFRVFGVDIDPQPDYCGDGFHQGDAVEFIRRWGRGFTAIHASPPCQGESAPTKGSNAARNKRNGTSHPRLITTTRTALRELDVPWVIENVAGSSVRKDLTLCGEMWGLDVLLHRYFELSDGIVVEQPRHRPHRGYVRGWRHGIWRDGPYLATYGKGGGKATEAEIRRAKGIDWMRSRHELTEAIPPVYTEYIGSRLMGHLRDRAA